MHGHARDWQVTINPSKTKSMTFSTKQIKLTHPVLLFDNKVIDTVSNHKHLGVTISSNLSWRAHIFNIYEKASEILIFYKRFAV